MNILMTQKKAFEKQIGDLQVRLADLECKKGSKDSIISNVESKEEDEMVKHEVGEATCETDTNANGHNKVGSQEYDDMMKQNQRLSQKVKSLEDEIETVSGLLEETIMSIKEKDDEIEALRGGSNNGKGVLGMLGGQGAKGHEHKKVKNFSHYTDEEIKQLERICKLHQLTIIRQRSQAKAMKTELDEALSQVEKYKTEIRINEEKVSVLESQFAELNKITKKCPETTLDASNDDSGEDGRCSIAKVDAAYLSSLEDKANKDKATIEGLLNEKRILKERIETMKEKLNAETILRAKVDDLSSSLEARELELKHLEDTYKARRLIVQRSTFGVMGSFENTNNTSEIDECTIDELKEIISHRDRMVAQLKSQITQLEQVSSHPIILC
jgi:chromosome segregation ATPase